MNVSATNTTRTITGSMSKYLAMPAATPPITRSLRERSRRRGPAPASAPRARRGAGARGLRRRIGGTRRLPGWLAASRLLARRLLPAGLLARRLLVGTVLRILVVGVHRGSFRWLSNVRHRGCPPSGV